MLICRSLRQASFVVHLLALLSFANAFFTFWRTRHYRLFETPIDQTPSTPSAHRVRVDSSPLASSPLRYLQNMLRTDSAESRSHARAGRDVWEIDVWDPSPLSLRLFCLFSPGHVMVYWLFLPLAPLDPRPSVTVVTTIFLAALLSAQMTLMQLFFTQKSKDSTIIHKEVQNEYDTKFVQPTINKPVRSAGTQCISNDTPKNTHEVLVSTPTTYVNRGFITNPNTNYLSHYDPEAANSPQAIQERLINRTVNTPNLRSLAMNSAADFSSPLRSTPGNVRQPQVGSTPQASNGGGGGNLGVHTHAQSPLKKGTGISSERHRLSTGSRPAGFRQLSPPKRPTSPLKRVSTPADSGQNGGLQNRFSHLRGGDKDRERRPY